MSLDLGAVLPELILVLGAMGGLMAGVFGGEGASRRLSWYAVAVLALAGIVLALSVPNPTPALGGMVVNDAFAVFMKLLVLTGAALGVILSIDFNERENLARFEFPILVLFATSGMTLMVSANDLISLYVALELQSLSLYVIAAFNRDNLRSTEAGLKYFVLGALSSGLLLYGASLIYGFVGTTQFGPIAEAIRGMSGPAPVGVIFGLVFITAGLVFKVSGAPFHMWTPDVYEGAPTPVTAFFSVAPKIAAMALLLRVFMQPFAPLTGSWTQLVWVVSVLSMLIGAFAAIWQDNIKRLMAYSSIGHIGYALIGIAAGGAEGVQAVLVYMAIYLFMNVATFAVIVSMRRDGRAVEQISDLAGLAGSAPLIAAAVAIAMFSMAGIPPLAGFFGKIYVFLAAIKSGFIVLAVIGVLTSVVGAFYYLRIIKVMYFDPSKQPIDGALTRPVGWVLAGTTLFTLLFFILPSPLIVAAGRAAASLVGAR